MVVAWRLICNLLEAALVRDQRVDDWPLLPELARGPSLLPDRYLSMSSSLGAAWIVR